MLIYMLYDHEEHGLQDYAMTTDSTVLGELFLQLWPSDPKYRDQEEAEMTCMRKHIAEGKPGHFKLGRGWGGPHLVIAAPCELYGLHHEA